MKDKGCSGGGGRDGIDTATPGEQCADFVAVGRICGGIAPSVVACNPSPSHREASRCTETGSKTKPARLCYHLILQLFCGAMLNSCSDICFDFEGKWGAEGWWRVRKQVEKGLQLSPRPPISGGVSRLIRPIMKLMHPCNPETCASRDWAYNGL